MIQFNHAELQTLFDHQRIINHEIEQYEYSVILNNRFTFFLYFIGYEDFVALMLQHTAYEKPLFNLGFYRISEIKIIDKNLALFANKQQEPFLTVIVKPMVSLVYQAN